MTTARRTGRELSTHDAFASGTRRRLLEMLDERGPLDAHILATELGLHVTTVRSHLDVLHRTGLVTARPLPRASAGRPRMAYATVSRAATGYPALTVLLAGHLGATREVRATRAEKAGVAWAAELTADPATSGVSADAAARQVTGLFTAMGFDPELMEPTASGNREIRLRGCPFRAAARTHPEVICSVHLGLLRGTLTRLGAPPTAAGLQPFVEPELCVAHLSPAA